MRLLFYLALLLCIHQSATGHAQSAAPPPNIVFIMADDLGYGDLSCYGGKDIQTPHIDALAQSGMRFTQYYANSTVCSPTRAALLSGMYPDKAGVPGVVRPYAFGNFGYLRPDTKLLPAYLQSAGYATALIGKWHLGLESPNLPTDRGFDHYKGWLSGMMDYYTHRQHEKNFMRAGKEAVDEEGHATELFTDWAIDYLKERDAQRPFFLYLAYTAPHDPIQPPKEWLEKIRQRGEIKDENRAKLVALAEHLDHSVGRVIETLENRGLRENTLIVFCSDNGGALRFGASNGKYRGGKGDMYEGGIRVPAIVSWPGKAKAAVDMDAVVMSMDWFSTFCRLAGLEEIPERDGLNLLPLLLGETDTTAERTLFWVRREGWGHGGRAYYAARKGPYKILQNTATEPMQLFNLAEDPEEQHPLDTEEHPEFKALRKALQRHIQAAGAVPWQAPNKVKR